MSILIHTVRFILVVFMVNLVIGQQQSIEEWEKKTFIKQLYSKNTMLPLGFENAATWEIYEKSLQDDFQKLKGPYLGQTAPSDFAEIFLDGIISKFDSPEMCAGFTNNGKEFFYNARNNNNWAIFSTREINGKWIKPKALSFTGDYGDRDFTMSPDGNKIYFGSNRPVSGSPEGKNDLDIFVTARISSNQWSNPMNIGLPVNTNRSENYPSVARNGNLYFFSLIEGGFGGYDIYVSKPKNGKYTEPKNLGSSINSEKHDWDSYISPDESFIIFSSKDRDDTIGKQDLYISFRKNDGSWTKARNMGSSINSEHDEICPSVSLDGKYLFFTSRRRGKADIFWIKAEIIEKLRPKDN